MLGTLHFCGSVAEYWGYGKCDGQARHTLHQNANFRIIVGGPRSLARGMRIIAMLLTQAHHNS